MLLGMSDELRRSKVDELLRACVSEKLRIGQPGLALEKAEQAFSRAIQLPELHSPWPELAAYRLAHLMLRSSDCDSVLSEIEVLLRLAGRTGLTGNQPVLAPRPAIYRLAVLQRLLRGASNETVRNWVESQISDCFKRARDQVADLRRESRMATGTETGTQTGPIQDSFFNMLELAAYFLGESYSPLEGLGALDIENLSDSNAWVIVGPDPQIASVRMSCQYALSELESRGKSHPEAVLFRLSPEPDGVEWKLASASEWKDANDEEIKLLAYMLKEPSMPKVDLKRKVVGIDGADPDARFRKVKERARDGLQDLTGKAHMKVFVSGRGPVKFADHPMLFGAVHLKTLGR